MHGMGIIGNGIGDASGTIPLRYRTLGKVQCEGSKLVKFRRVRSASTGSARQLAICANASARRGGGTIGGSNIGSLDKLHCWCNSDGCHFWRQGPFPIPCGFTSQSPIKGSFHLPLSEGGRRIEKVYELVNAKCGLNELS